MKNATKKLRFIVMLIMLFNLIGCQKNINDSEDLVTKFLQEYFEVDYHEEKEINDYINDYYFDKMETYFMESCFEKDFLTLGYVRLPTEIALKYKSGIKINEIEFDKKFEEKDSVGYELTVHLYLDNNEYTEETS